MSDHGISQHWPHIVSTTIDPWSRVRCLSCSITFVTSLFYLGSWHFTIVLWYFTGQGKVLIAATGINLLLVMSETMHTSKNTSGQPVLHTKCLRGTEILVFWTKTKRRLLIPCVIVDRLTPPLCINKIQIWGRFTKLLIVDLGWICVDCLTLPPGSTEAIDCWSSQWWSLIHPLPQDQQRWLPFHVKVKVDCQLSQCQLLIPPRINRHDCLSTLSIISVLTVDWPPLQIFDFLIFNVRMSYTHVRQH